MIDRVAAKIGRSLVEVPVGFKWFVDGLLDGSLGFGGEESAGASFLRRDGTVWTTDKDGIIMDLLAVEMMARTGRDPGELYDDLTREFGAPVYERIDAPATPEQKAVLPKLSPQDVDATELAGDPIQAMLTSRAWQRRGHRRLEGGHRAGLVRGASLGHGRGLQAVCRELPRRRAPAAHSGRGASDSGKGFRRRRGLMAALCAASASLGIDLDPGANARAGPRISTVGEVRSNPLQEAFEVSRAFA